MKRLTTKSQTLLIECCGCIEEDNCYGNSCGEIEKAISKLKEYEDLEEQGLLLKLPCKVGDYIWNNDFEKPCSYEITGFSFGNLNQDNWKDEVITFNQVIVYYTNSNGSITGNFAASEIGKTVFLTQAEAEEALKGNVNYEQ